MNSYNPECHFENMGWVVFLHSEFAYIGSVFMNKKIAITCIVILGVMLPNLIFANSAPVYIQEYPSFEVLPMDDFPVEVEGEDLEIELDEYSPSKASVKGEYKIKNTSGEDISATMIFPYISEGYFEFGAIITLDGNAVPYETYFAGEINPVDYFEDPEGFAKQVDMDSIIDSLNSPQYKPVNFDDMSETSIYSIEFESPTKDQLELSFEINPEKTRVLAVNFSGIEVDDSGKCRAFEHIGKSDVGEKGYILVLGEDTLYGIESSTGWEIDEEAFVVKDFIMEKIINSNDSWYYNPNRNIDSLYKRFIKRTDDLFGESHIVSDSNTVMEEILANNISVLLYDIDIKAGQESAMSVKYPIKATIDRRKSNDYVNTFAYILNTAEKFRDFNELEITVKLNGRHPYIIESSLPLNHVGDGIYRGYFDELPEKDFVFSTYPKEEIEKKPGFIGGFWAVLFENGNVGLVFVFWGFIGVSLAVVRRNRISVYNRQMEILEGMETEFLRLQFEFSFASYIFLIMAGLCIYVNNPDEFFIMIVPIVFKLIYYLFGIASENRGYSKKAA